MKNISILISLTFFLFSCKKETEVLPVENNHTEISVETTVKHLTVDYGLYKTGDSLISLSYKLIELNSMSVTYDSVSVKYNTYHCMPKAQLPIRDFNGNLLLYNYFVEYEKFLSEYKVGEWCFLNQKYNQSYVSNVYFTESALNFQSDYNNITDAKFRINEIAYLSTDHLGYKYYHVNVSLRWKDSNGNYEAEIRTMLTINI